MKNKTIEFKPEFEEKLKKLRVKTKFIQHLKKYAKDHHLNLKAEVDGLNKMLSWHSFINAAFIWSHTKEGHHFWSEIARGNKSNKGNNYDPRRN